MSTITVRGIDPVDKSWLECEAQRSGVSLEEFVRRLIRDQRRKAERRLKPSEAFVRYFRPRHGVELAPPARHGYRPLDFSDEVET